jgi:F0F1-type ATP synthase gamma subunit
MKKTERERIQDVVEVLSSNTFASIQRVSEDNLKEFLVSRTDPCILLYKHFTLSERYGKNERRSFSNRIKRPTSRGLTFK